MRAPFLFLAVCCICAAGDQLPDYQQMRKESEDSARQFRRESKVKSLAEMEENPFWAEAFSALGMQPRGSIWAVWPGVSEEGIILREYPVGAETRFELIHVRAVRRLVPRPNASPSDAMDIKHEPRSEFRRACSKDLATAIKGAWSDAFRYRSCLLTDKRGDDGLSVYFHLEGDPVFYIWSPDEGTHEARLFFLVFDLLGYLKQKKGEAEILQSLSEFRQSLKTEANKTPLPTPVECPPSNYDQVPGAADL